MSHVCREQSYKNMERKAKSEKKIHYRPRSQSSKRTRVILEISTIDPGPSV
jgi:hypothetical protein